MEFEERDQVSTNAFDYDRLRLEINENGLYELFNAESGKSVEVDEQDNQCEDDEDAICMIVPAYLPAEI